MAWIGTLVQCRKAIYFSSLKILKGHIFVEKKHAKTVSSIKMRSGYNIVSSINILKVVDHFVDIGRIDDHHCLKFLFIIIVKK